MLSDNIKKTEGNARFQCRATYIRGENGERILSRIEESNRPIYIPESWEKAGEKRKSRIIAEPEPPEEPDITGNVPDTDIANKRRAIRRASIRCMDLVACNRFDWFCTLTLDPAICDRKSYSETVEHFGRWASNGVQRDGLRYVAVPEYHLDGESIHLHMLATDNLRLTDSGVNQRGKRVYNITNWKWGFTNCKRITGTNSGIACAKYCLKYMRKQEGQKIGGRYFLCGGDLIRPEYEYANTPEELNPDGREPVWTGEVAGEWGTYKKYSYV